MSESIKVIAYYLPQFHETQENNKWWGPGFTEWTNVGKAKPLFKNHYQPKVPADLGYYDLRYNEIKVKQIHLAREAGISAFCFWHYWLGDGERLLEKPFNQFVENDELDFPFCLGWANHDWQRKDWSTQGSVFVKETLATQKYGGVEDYKNHFFSMLNAFQDKRYFKIDNRLLFTIFRPDSIPDFNLFAKIWNSLAKENGLNGFYFIACIVDKKDVNKYISEGYDKVNLSMLNYPFNIKYDKFSIAKRIFKAKIINKVNVVDYKKAIQIYNDSYNYKEEVCPTIIPNWDHTPRSGIYGNVLHNSTPKLFKVHVNSILTSLSRKMDKIVFLKSWNEWGEGNYIEPDLRYGKDYINVLRECLDNVRNED